MVEGADEAEVEEAGWPADCLTERQVLMEQLPAVDEMFLDMLRGTFVL
jgi:hypothetical protein